MLVRTQSTLFFRSLFAACLVVFASCNKTPGTNTVTIVVDKNGAPVSQDDKDGIVDSKSTPGPGTGSDADAFLGEGVAKANTKRARDKVVKTLGYLQRWKDFPLVCHNRGNLSARISKMIYESFQEGLATNEADCRSNLTNPGVISQMLDPHKATPPLLIHLLRPSDTLPPGLIWDPGVHAATLQEPAEFPIYIEREYAFESAQQLLTGTLLHETAHKITGPAGKNEPLVTLMAYALVYFGVLVGHDDPNATEAFDFSKLELRLSLDDEPGSQTLVNAANGETVGACTTSGCPAFGMAGQIFTSAGFAGSDWIDLGQISMSGSVSACAWIKLDTVPSSSNYLLSNRYGYESKDQSFSLGVMGRSTDVPACRPSNPNQVVFLFREAYLGAGQPPPLLLCGKTGIEKNQWHHACVVRDLEAKTVKLFVDGKSDEVIDASATGSTFQPWHRYPEGAEIQIQAPTNVPKLHLGNPGSYFLGTHYYFRGGVDDLWLFQRAISDLEVKALYDRGALPLYPQ